MQIEGHFVTPLDLGVIGQHDAAVYWDMRRVAGQAADSYDILTISRVAVDLCGSVIDVRRHLGEELIDDLKSQSMEDFQSPPKGVVKRHADAMAGRRRAA